MLDNATLLTAVTIPPGSMAWRQKPGAYTGHSHVRFCSICVERGGPPPAPELSILCGGSPLADSTPRGSLALAPESPEVEGT